MAQVYIADKTFRTGDNLDLVRNEQQVCQPSLLNSNRYYNSPAGQLAADAE